MIQLEHQCDGREYATKAIWPGLVRAPTVIKHSRPSMRCDYLAQRVEKLTFTAGQTSKTINISVVDDAMPRAQKTFTTDVAQVILRVVRSVLPFLTTLDLPPSVTTTASDRGQNPLDGAVVSLFVSTTWTSSIANLMFLVSIFGQIKSTLAVPMLSASRSSGSMSQRRSSCLIEFQETGYLEIYRMRKTSFGDLAGTPVSGSG